MAHPFDAAAEVVRVEPDHVVIWVAQHSQYYRVDYTTLHMGGPGPETHITRISTCNEHGERVRVVHNLRNVSWRDAVEEAIEKGWYA